MKDTHRYVIETANLPLSEKATKHAQLKDKNTPFNIKVDLYGHE